MPVQDFKEVAKNPALVGVGAALQYTIMPLMGFLVSRAADLPPAAAVGWACSQDRSCTIYFGISVPVFVPSLQNAIMQRLPAAVPDRACPLSAATADRSSQLPIFHGKILKATPAVPSMLLIRLLSAALARSWADDGGAGVQDLHCGLLPWGRSFQCGHLPGQC